MPVEPLRQHRWPEDRGARGAFGKRFGETWRDRFETALTDGDPLADALVAVGGERGARVRHQLALGLVAGLASIDEPDPVVVDLLASTERVPPHVDAALIASGPRAWYDVPFRLHLLSMSAGALIGVYASPSIASVLCATGRLNDSTERRLRDTARWLSSTMLPGSLVPGESGYVATVQLRLLHAHARRTARRRGHDERRFGTAINQVDLAGTWLAFTLAAMRAEASLGFAPSEEGVTETYGYWQQLAHLLGIDAALVGDVRTHVEAERLETMIDATSGRPVTASAMLTERTLAAVAKALDGVSTLPDNVSRRLLDTLVRRFHGDARADALQVERTPGASLLMAPVVALARVSRAVSRGDVECWSAAGIGRYADALESALADQDTVPQAVPSVVDVARAPAPLAVPVLPEPSVEPALREVG